MMESLCYWSGWRIFHNIALRPDIGFGHVVWVLKAIKNTFVDDSSELSSQEYHDCLDPQIL